MTQMKDSTVNPAWIAEQMRLNPPRMLPNGNIFSGPVRLAFANILKPGKPNNQNAEGKYGAALLFPPGTDFRVFNEAWMRSAHEAFPRNWDPQGKPVGLHLPFHNQDEKAFGPKPMAGYTPGALTFNTSSKFQPSVVDANMNPILDENRVYSGVWAFVSVNTYKYGPPQPKSGIAFGLQTVMIIGDDSKLSGGGGNPQQDFAGVTITATANVADKFAQAGAMQGGVLPAGGHVGLPGQMQTYPVGAALTIADLE